MEDVRAGLSETFFLGYAGLNTFRLLNNYTLLPFSLVSKEDFLRLEIPFSFVGFFPTKV